MEHNVVPLHFYFEGEHIARLDAEYAQASLLDIENQVEKKTTGHKLNDLVNEYDGPTVNESLEDADNIVTYLSIDSIDTDDGLTYSDYLFFKDRPSRAKYVVNEGDILVSNVRPNRGAIALVTHNFENALASSGFTLLRPKDTTPLSISTIFTFMRSRYARDQLIRKTRGSMYPAVLSRDVLDTYVPIPPDSLQKQIDNLIDSSLLERGQFDKLYKIQAAKIEKFLASICPAPPSPLDGPDIGVSSNICNYSVFSPGDESARFDAEFFRKEYFAFEGLLTSKAETFHLGEYFDLSTGRGLSNPIETVPYIKQGVLTNIGVNWSAVSYETGDPSSDRGRVRTGDILLACTAHEVYYVARKVDFVQSVPKELEDKNFCVADIIILRSKPNKPKEIPGEYVAAFLRSPWGLHQVQRCIRGLRGGHVYSADLSRFVHVPKPPKIWLNEFKQTFADMEERRIQAKKDVQAAVDLYEQWITLSIK